jgi:hypothetical protein
VPRVAVRTAVLRSFARAECADASFYARRIKNRFEVYIGHTQSYVSHRLNPAGCTRTIYTATYAQPRGELRRQLMRACAAAITHACRAHEVRDPQQRGRAVGALADARGRRISWKVSGTMHVCTLNAINDYETVQDWLLLHESPAT